MVDTESLAPVDFERLYDIVELLYSEDGGGQRSIDPVVLFKLVMLQHLDGRSILVCAVCLVYPQEL